MEVNGTRKPEQELGATKMYRCRVIPICDVLLAILSAGHALGDEPVPAGLDKAEPVKRVTPRCFIYKASRIFLGTENDRKSLCFPISSLNSWGVSPFHFQTRIWSKATLGPVARRFGFYPLLAEIVTSDGRYDVSDGNDRTLRANIAVRVRLWTCFLRDMDIVRLPRPRFYERTKSKGLSPAVRFCGTARSDKFCRVPFRGFWQASMTIMGRRDILVNEYDYTL